MYEYKMISINLLCYLGIDIKKLRVCCIVYFGFKKNLFLFYISSCGKVGYIGLIFGFIIKSNEINYKIICLLLFM